MKNDNEAQGRLRILHQQVHNISKHQRVLLVVTAPEKKTATGFGITPQPDEHTFTKHNGTNPTVPIGTQGSRQKMLDVFGLIRQMEYESSNVNMKNL